MRHHAWIQILLSGALGCAGTILAQELRLDPASAANAASYIPASYPNGGISHGGMFIVKASAGSAPLGACGVAVAQQFPIATDMNGTSMKITMGSASFDVPMIYVVACSGTDQLAGIVPSAVPPGTGTLTVSYNGKTATAPLTVVDRVPGLFTINQGGTGAAIIQNYNSPTDLPINTLANAAAPGQYAIAWGTGLGPDGNADNTAPNPTDIPVNLELYVGGKLATVTYKGRSGCCAGIDQIVFQVPSGVEGCFVPVVAKIGTSVGNFTTMSIATGGGACSDASGFTSADIQAAQRSGKLRLGIVNLIRADAEFSITPNTGSVTRTDQAAAAFADLSFVSLLGLPVREISVPGSCTVWRGTSSDLILDRPPILASYINLDAGTIAISNANGAAPMSYRGGYYRVSLGSAANREPSGGPYSGPLKAYLEPGSITVSSSGGGPLPGGKSIGSFTAAIPAVAPPSFDNRFAVSDVQRGQGVTVNWSGADSSSLVEIRGISISNAPPASGVSFFCAEKASAGQFTIPPAVLLSLPASSGKGTTLGLSVGAVRGTRFTAPGIDLGLLRFTALFGRNVNYR
jgi:uncharacterized protein (TIGR03437 family)